MVGKIRAAALDVFLEQGYRQASVADVAARAGLTEAEVREVFASKQDLLEAALAPAYDDVEALLDAEDLTAEVFLERYVDLSLADRKALRLAMVDSGIAVAHPTLGPRIRPLAARMLVTLGAGDEASRVHAWAALAVIESTIAYQPGISSARMRGPLLAAARGALRGAR
jgi:AcrR family transcriptional regulator